MKDSMILILLYINFMPHFKITVNYTLLTPKVKYSYHCLYDNVNKCFCIFKILIYAYTNRLLIN